MSENNFDLMRFKNAQQRSYSRALAEIRNGRKAGHWIWYIFPQIIGLGRSDVAQYYSIVSLEDARSYLDDDELNDNLTEITSALLECGEKDPNKVFGSLDAMKVKSSMTLFEAAEGDPVFSQVLDDLYDGQRDQLTLNILEEQKKNTN